MRCWGLKLRDTCFCFTHISIHISISMQSRYVCTFTARDRYLLHPRTWTIFLTDALLQEADYLFKVDRGSHRPRWQPRKCNRWFSFPGRLSALAIPRGLPSRYRYVTFRDPNVDGSFQSRPTDEREALYIKSAITSSCATHVTRFSLAIVLYDPWILRSKIRERCIGEPSSASNEYIRKVFGGNNRSRRSVLNPNVGF